MKHLFIMLIFCIITTAAFSQWTTSGTYIYNTNTGGNVGIGFDGTTGPTATLGVKSASETALQLETSNTSSAVDLIFKSTYNQWKISKSAQGTGSPSGAAGTLAFTYNTNVYGGDRPVLTLNNDVSNWSVQFGTATTSTLGGPNVAIEGDLGARRMTLSSGNTWLAGGTTLLAVDGGIGCRTVTVTTTSFPDYVFKPGYHLRSLAEVNQYIHDNGHLPGIAAAAEIEKEGMELSQMTKNLVEKVEELTLYMIDLKQENDDLRKKVDALTKK